MGPLFGSFFYALKDFNAFSVTSRVDQIEVEGVRVWFHYRQRTDIRKISFALNEVAILSHHGKLELGPSKAAKLRETFSFSMNRHATRGARFLPASSSRVFRKTSKAIPKDVSLPLGTPKHITARLISLGAEMSGSI